MTTTYRKRFQECRDKEDFVDLCIDMMGDLDNAEERARLLRQGQQLLMNQTVRIRRAALGLQEGEPDTSQGIDTEDIVRRLKENHDTLTDEAGIDYLANGITPNDKPGDSRTGTIKGYTPKQIEAVLGFPANCIDDESKVKYSWGFNYKGQRFGIWDYYRSYKVGEWSTFGDEALLKELFP